MDKCENETKQYMNKFYEDRNITMSTSNCVIMTKSGEHIKHVHTLLINTTVTLHLQKSIFITEKAATFVADHYIQKTFYSVQNKQNCRKTNNTLATPHTNNMVNKGFA